MQTREWTICLVTLAASLAGLWAQACPFCDAQGETLAQQRESAEIVGLAEVRAAVEKSVRLKWHHLAKGKDRLVNAEMTTVPSDRALKVGQLVMAFGSAEKEGQRTWTLEPVNEVSAAYILRAPGLEVAPLKRLGYFRNYLEHDDATIADDAYLEFGYAPFDQVEAVAGEFSAEQLQDWLESERIPPKRKGLYGLLLGLVANDNNDAAAKRFLRQLIVEPEEDFRQGFDGILGGYLIAAESAGLDLIQKQILANPAAAVGDVRHALNAVRFYFQYGQSIPEQRLQAALRTLLARPEFAAEVIADLARFKDWDALEHIVALYDRKGYDKPLIQRAILIYLFHAPGDRARAEIERFRKRDPELVKEAEQLLPLAGGLR